MKKLNKVYYYKSKSKTNKNMKLSYNTNKNDNSTAIYKGYLQKYLIKFGLVLLLIIFSTQCNDSNSSKTSGTPNATDLLITEFRSNNSTDIYEQGMRECDGFDNMTAFDCTSNFIEVANTTGAPIDLTQYALLYSSDGSSGNWPTTDTVVCTDDTLSNNVSTSTCNRLKLSGMLANANLVVVSRPDHNRDKIVIANFIWNNFTADGNDGVALAKEKGLDDCPAGTLEHTYTPFTGSTSPESENYCIIDTVGEPYGGDSDNADPGDAWAVAGELTDDDPPQNAPATQMIIRRKPSVLSPTINWTLSRGTDEANSQWIVVNENDFDNVGELTNGSGMQIVATLPPATPTAPIESPSAPPTSIAITIEWTAVPGAASYEVHRSDMSDFSNPQKIADSLTTTSYEDTNVDASTDYYYKIAACNSQGCSSLSPELMLRTPVALSTAPSPPEAPTEGMITNTSITIGWTAVVGATHYEVHRSLIDDDFSNSEPIVDDLNSIVYTDRGLSIETTYFYKIKACNNIGCSAFSPQLAVTTRSLLPPAAPTERERTTTSIIIEWTRVPEATYYEVHRKSSDSSADDYAKIADNVTTFFYEDTDVDASTFYDYKIAACNIGGGCSSLSPALERLRTMPILSPDSPAAPIESPNAPPTSIAITIDWTAVPESTYYEVHRSNMSDFSDSGLLSRVNITLTSYEDTGLSASTDYYYQIAACNSAGCSELSPALMLSTPAALDTAPATPTEPTVRMSTSTSIIIDWMPVDGATHYEVHRSLVDDDFSDSVLIADNLNRLSYEDTDLDASTTYYYKIKACNDNDSDTDCSAISPQVSSMTMAKATDLLISEFSLDIPSGANTNCTGFDGRTDICTSTFIELANLTGSSIDLSQYALLYSHNDGGGNWPNEGVVCTEISPPSNISYNIPTSTCNRLKLSGMLADASLLLVAREIYDTAKFTANFVWQQFLPNGNDGNSLS